MALVSPLLFAAAQKEINLNIKGMTCQMCAGSVKKTLLETDGVKDAKIYLKDGKAVVKSEKDIDLATLNAKLKPHGYSATTAE